MTGRLLSRGEVLGLLAALALVFVAAVVGSATDGTETSSTRPTFVEVVKTDLPELEAAADTDLIGYGMAARHALDSGASVEDVASWLADVPAAYLDVDGATLSEVLIPALAYLEARP